MKNINLVGTIINELKIINYFSKDGRQFFECICVCGEKFSSRTEAIKNGSTKSCGCLSGNLISQKNKLPDNMGAYNLFYRIYKKNAKNRELEFSLTIDEFKKITLNFCYYCGTPPALSKILKNQNKYNRRDVEMIHNGIDRINSEIGYVLNNCVACCSICNRAKSNLSLNQFQDWLNQLIHYNNDK